MDDKTIVEVVAAFLGIWMIAFPSFFLKFLAKGAQLNYENYKSTFKRAEKGQKASSGEEFAYKYGPKALRDIAMNKDVYGPQTTAQKWLMRALGIVLVGFSLGVLLNLIEFH